MRRVSQVQKKIIAARAQWRCEHCDSLLESTFQIDHKIPLWLGGSNDASNLQALCVSCHAAKTQEEQLPGRVFQRVLHCSMCRQTLSPYFTHKCPEFGASVKK